MKGEINMDNGITKQKPVYYCNIARVDATSVNDFMIGFGYRKNPSLPINEDDMDFQILTSPQHLKALVLMLTEHLRIYEKLFGEINLQPNQDSIQELGDKVQVTKES